jgi:hypothetical protein
MSSTIRALKALTWPELLAVAVGIILAGSAWSQSGPLVGLVAFGCVATMTWHLAAAHDLDAQRRRRAAVWARRDRDAEMREQLRAGRWS